MASSSIPATINENDPATILASLCVNAPDVEVRDLLRRYNHDKTYSKNLTSLKAVKKDIIVRTAEYLNIETKNVENENKEMKKAMLIAFPGGVPGRGFGSLSGSPWAPFGTRWGQK